MCIRDSFSNSANPNRVEPRLPAISSCSSTSNVQCSTSSSSSIDRATADHHSAAPSPANRRLQTRQPGTETTTIGSCDTFLTSTPTSTVVALRSGLGQAAVRTGVAVLATVRVGRGRGRRGNRAPIGGITLRSAGGEGTAARYARISATVRRGKRHPTGNTRARWCSGRKSAVSWSMSGGQVRGNRAPTGRMRRRRGLAVGVEQVPDGRGVGGRLCPTRDAVSRYWQVTPLKLHQMDPFLRIGSKVVVHIPAAYFGVGSDSARSRSPSGGALDVVQVRGCVTI